MGGVTVIDWRRHLFCVTAVVGKHWTGWLFFHIWSSEVLRSRSEAHTSIGGHQKLAWSLADLANFSKFIGHLLHILNSYRVQRGSRGHHVVYSCTNPWLRPSSIWMCPFFPTASSRHIPVCPGLISLLFTKLPAESDLAAGGCCCMRTFLCDSSLQDNSC